MLDRQGLEVIPAALSDPPTLPEGGDDALPDWVRMFGSRLSESLAAADLREYDRLVPEFAEPQLPATGWPGCRLLPLAHRGTQNW